VGTAALETGKLGTLELGERKKYFSWIHCHELIYRSMVASDDASNVIILTIIFA
jgi:hypothetical protein